jgi:hypothetical protein
MGARFLHSIARVNTDFPTASSFPTIDLPVNPLSLVLLNFELTNTAPAALLTYSAIDDLLTNVTNVIIKHKGENIIAGQLRDLVYINALVGRRFPGWDRLAQTTAGIRRVTIPLGFGRRNYDPKECFPATSRGNLTLDITRAANPAGFSDVNLTVETVELIEATPDRYLKYTPQSQTAIVGIFDQALPIGNPYVALAFFDTALATLDTATSSWGQVKLLKDNVEQYYPLSDSQTLSGMSNMFWEGMPMDPGHVHGYDGAQAGMALSDDASIPVSQGMRGYFAMNFDPNHDDMYLMETAGAADIKIRANGTSATAVRVTPVELVSVKK